MKRSILLLVISLLFCSYTIGQSFKRDFLTALKAKEMIKAEEILKAWDLADSNDAELYIGYFNFYTVKSQNTGISTTGYDANFSQKALDFITEGIDRFPTRFDMRVAKIYMLGQLKKFPAYTEEAVKLIEYSKKIDNNWKGENFSLIERPVEIFFGAVQQFQEKLFSEKNPALYKDIIKISNEMVKIYPKHVQSWMNLSTIYIEQKEYNKSIEALLKAKETEPKNAILLYNIADVYNMKGDKVNAKKHYELTIANTSEKEIKLQNAAQQKLNTLK